MCPPLIGDAAAAAAAAVVGTCCTVLWIPLLVHRSQGSSAAAGQAGGLLDICATHLGVLRHDDRDEGVAGSRQQARDRVLSRTGRSHHPLSLPLPPSLTPATNE